MREKLHYYLHMIRTKVILLFVSVMVLMLALFLGFSFRLEQSFYEKLVDANSGLLRYYAGIMESEFNAAELFFTEQRLQQNVYLQVETAEGVLDQYLADYAVRQIFDDFLQEAGCLNMIFLCSPDRNTWIQCSYGLDSAAEQALSASLQAQIQNDAVITTRWTQQTVGQSLYLCYIIPVHNSWVGGVVDPDSLISQIDLEKNDEIQAVALLDSAFCPVSGGYSREDGAAIQSAAERGATELTLFEKRYLVSMATVRDGAFSLVGLTEKNLMQGQMGTERLVLIGGVVLLLGIGIGLVVVLWRSLVTPLSHITDGILELQKGNFSYQLEEEKSSEFAQITTAFNSVGREIGELKITVYEERLERQRTELQFLQSQLNPHFLINCINNLRTLVLQGKLQEFQTMLIELGTYLRGTITMQKLIPLEQEIKNVTAYVQLQKIRYQDRISVEFHIFEELLSVPVPVHVIQTFVENAVKYGLSAERPLMIEIIGDLSESRDDVLTITILDDGPGFLPEVLEQLQNSIQVFKDGRECIGLTNTAQRLRLQYGEAASMVCSNRDSGGACVSLEIPIETGEM